MKQYNKLKLPSDSAWERKTWKRFINWRVIEFLRRIKNLVGWFPTIWSDRNWDHSFILKILQKKIEFQRNYLVSKNRHKEVSVNNKYMTLALNLIERELCDYYSMEKYDYQDSEIEFAPVEDMHDLRELKINLKSENFSGYLKKYPSAVRKIKKIYPEKDFNDLETLSFYVGLYNQDRCNKLLYKILEQHLSSWWD